MQFDGNEAKLRNHDDKFELGFLIDVILNFKRARIIDFSKDFTVNCYI